MKKALLKRLQAQFPPLLDPQTNDVVVNARRHPETGGTTVQVPHRNGQRRVLDAWRKLPPKLRATLTEVLDANPSFDIVQARNTLTAPQQAVFDKAFMIQPEQPPAAMKEAQRARSMTPRPPAPPPNHTTTDKGE